MLKTLEEPPPGTIIILVTARRRCSRPSARASASASMRRVRCRHAGLARSHRGRGPARSPPRLTTVAARVRIGITRSGPHAIETGLLDWEAELRPFLSAIERGR